MANENDALLQIAKALQAMFLLQVNEVKATSAVAQYLEADYPGLNAAVVEARKTALLPRVELLEQLSQQINAIVRQLSK